MADAKTARRAKRLWIAAGLGLLGFPVFAVLHEAFGGLAMLAGGENLVAHALDLLGVACFFLALVSPATALLFASAALVTRLTAGGPVWLRRALLVMVPAGAAWFGIRLVSGNRFSLCEEDESAGLNGSFEVVRSGLPVNWCVYRQPLEKGDAELAIDSTRAVEGARSLRFHVRSVGSRWQAGLFQVVDAREGGTYDVSFSVRNEGSTARLLVTSETPESRYERRPIEASLGPARTGKDEWRRFSYRYTVPAHYANVRFEVRLIAPGTIWLDDVRIEPAAPGAGGP